MSVQGPRSNSLLATLLLAMTASVGVVFAGAESVSDPVLDALAAEVQRAMTTLAESDPAPYFIAV